MRPSILCLWVLLPVFPIAPASARAQGETTHPNPDAPREVRQYEFMLGDWVGERYDRTSSGDRRSASIRWHGTYILDGWAFRTDWEQTNQDGSAQRGTMIRTFDQRYHAWRIAETYSANPHLDVFDGKVLGDSLVQSSEHDTPTGPVKARRVYFNISAKGFEDRIENSRDGGKTWQLQFRETFIRAPAKRES